ncbi:glycosyltransferase family 2 protein [Paenibacillus daejeonensis]|uniref:glycosyltransferase family 2 protein n=1 Tax=Paenibacillus daejeonensis TaxID=135193 RepID=UPI0003718E0E|nr:glycosyltransferase family A protein [Paenibacillus daejeonensis]
MNSGAGRSPGVSIITATHRPQFIKNLLANYARQQYRTKELIIILNNDSEKLHRYRQMAKGLPHVRIYQVSEKLSLGQCLNCGIAKAKHPLIAKFDDDDYYSPFYLQEQVNALIRTRSDVIGKHACLVYLEATKELIIRSPKHTNRPEWFVQGGTILFHRRVLKKHWFSDRSLGEDTKFLRDCIHAGYRVYSTSTYNYVYIRRSDKKSHTWRVKDAFYKKGSIPVAKGKPYRPFADRKLPL